MFPKCSGSVCHLKQRLAQMCGKRGSNCIGINNNKKKTKWCKKEERTKSDGKKIAIFSEIMDASTDILLQTRAFSAHNVQPSVSNRWDKNYILFKWNFYF